MTVRIGPVQSTSAVVLRGIEMRGDWYAMLMESCRRSWFRSILPHQVLLSLILKVGWMVDSEEKVGWGTEMTTRGEGGDCWHVRTSLARDEGRLRVCIGPDNDYPCSSSSSSSLCQTSLENAKYKYLNQTSWLRCSIIALAPFIQPATSLVTANLRLTPLCGVEIPRACRACDFRFCEMAQIGPVNLKSRLGD